ncbi:hypothetical protein TNIN_258361 [Trichonephila inaurata madagascariensis]|uniref:Uncharacterized protein n=1 Tax=Trichonephila inaurata madagascariensis TaxID=2747483 RepID=A0A8X6MKF2_9ARAC|nr:hypothetical protein TNIN_258361 [Trichonephila inaurata madagascariensis]
MSSLARRKGTSVPEKLDIATEEWRPREQTNHLSLVPPSSHVFPSKDTQQEGLQAARLHAPVPIAKKRTPSGDAPV